MEPKFNTSFIPKKSLQADTSASSAKDRFVGRRAIHGPGFFLMLLIFIACLVASIGVFGYTTVVDSNIEKKKQLLEEKKQAFATSIIDDLIRLETQIEYASRLVSEHVAVSQLFNQLEAVTLRDIQYTTLEYVDENDDPVLLTVEGVADGFVDIAQQVYAYRDSGGLTRPALADADRNEDDFMAFTIETGVDERLTSFSIAVQEGRLKGGVQKVIEQSTETEPPVTESATSTTGTSTDSENNTQ
jgi:hypothetical protein